MDGFEARELRYFVTVAEELNFSRAAERLGMAQPPLSRAIRQMERRLGADLFHRDTRHVALTDLGRTMLDEARFALDVLTAVTRRARRAAHSTPTLVVTAKPGIATGMLRRVVDAYAASPGAARVEITVGGYREQADMVRDGRADVALLGSYFDARGLDVEPLTTERRVAALPAGHPLTRRGELRCRDLRGEPVPQWPRSTPAERAYWSGRDRDMARPPSGAPDAGADVSGPAVSDPGQLIEVVALGQAVALIPESVADGNPRADVVYRPVTDATPYTIAVAWSEHSRAHHVARFVTTATSLYLARNVAS
ncbi:LysR family transcriptional regulator [Streptomyces litchfieldiae]|uniref:LysR family transcriptional regulator n=1 Tax=Streptomyces litchfieldiae TaxID=3075543 RepID=A0ABU2MZQ8_9ACTN|nr:LysR family transcriptional regulator [Streptomyces sp. DSM 44938]MDT0347136.1 LysR family transcriptional regulator [Streptomyces sp. DSM 44938]